MAQRIQPRPGDRYGRWTVIKAQQPREYTKSTKIAVWQCKCDCGTVRDVLQPSLLNGRSSSCGCYQKERFIERTRVEVRPGDKYGRLTLISEVDPRVGRARNFRRWLCRCECGVEKTVALTNLRKGNTRSCGCMQSELAAAKFRVHGMVGVPGYSTWKGMVARCCDPQNAAYPSYGGRGIRVHDEWRNDVRAFIRDVGERPGPGYSLDRINNDGNYEPGNVRWATAKEQQRNRRCNVMVSYEGEMMTLAEAAERSGIHQCTLWSRIHRGRHGSDLFAPLRRGRRKSPEPRSAA